MKDREEEKSSSAPTTILTLQDIEEKLETPNTIIRLFNKLYIFCRKFELTHVCYYKSYHHNLIFPNKTDEYDFFVNTNYKVFQFRNSCCSKFSSTHYQTILKSIKFIEPSTVHEEFLDCLKTLHVHPATTITEDERKEREDMHTQLIQECLNLTIFNISKMMYDIASIGTEHIIRFCEELTYVKITSYDKYPPFSDKPRKEYLLYILNKAINDGNDINESEIDMKTYLTHIIANKIRATYPTLGVEQLQSGNFLGDIAVRFDTKNFLL
jgi:hypothetical protein